MIDTPPRFVLVTPLRFDVARFAPVLDEALAAADVAAVILDLASDDVGDWRAAAAALCPAVQARGTAFLIRERVSLVEETGADGVHVSGGAAAVDAALHRFDADVIVGAGDCTTRHAAMSLGERQPSYVFLGRLDAEGDRPAAPTLVDWWAELFELPGVALAAEDWESLARAARGGADFIALRHLVWRDAKGPVAALQRAARAIAEEREAAA